MRHVITYKFILCMDILFKNIDILSKTSTCALWDKAHVKGPYTCALSACKSYNHIHALFI